MTSWSKVSATFVVLLCCSAHRAFSLTVTSTSSASSSGGGVAVSRAVGSSTGGGNTNVEAVAKAENGGTAIANNEVVNAGSGNVDSFVGSTASGPGAFALSASNIVVVGNADVTAGNFVTAINAGQGPVIAESILNAVAQGGSAKDAATKGFAQAVVTAVGNAPQNVANIASLTVDAFFGPGDVKAVFGEVTSILIARGCGAVQPYLQLVEAEVSNRGKQSEFLGLIDRDVNIIICVFPDTCGNNGDDRRGGCCSSGPGSSAKSQGKCNCDESGNNCNFYRIHNNPRGIWTCRQGLACSNTKPCICAA